MPEKIIMSSSQPNKDGANGDGGSNDYLKLQTSQKIRTNIQKISQLLNTGLSPEALDICVKLCEAGVHPQALAEVIQSVVQEMEALERETF